LILLAANGPDQWLRGSLGHTGEQLYGLCFMSGGVDGGS